MKGVGNKGQIGPPMPYGENSKKHIEKIFFEKKLNKKKFSKIWSKWKISVFKKILKTKNFCFKKHKN